MNFGTAYFGAWPDDDYIDAKTYFEVLFFRVSFVLYTRKTTDWLDVCGRGVFYVLYKDELDFWSISFSGWLVRSDGYNA